MARARRRDAAAPRGDPDPGGGGRRRAPELKNSEPLPTQGARSRGCRCGLWPALLATDGPALLDGRVDPIHLNEPVLPADDDVRRGAVRRRIGRAEVPRALVGVL